MIEKLLHDGEIFVWDEFHHMMDWTTMGWWVPLFWWLGVTLFIGIVLTLSYYVHRDAIRRNIPNAEIWVLIILIFNIFGAVTYLILRSNYNKRAVLNE